VPDVLDEEEDAARAALRDAGFEVRVRREDVETPDEDGIVLDQDPQPETPRPQGSEVTITVGRFEPEPVPEATETPEAVP
jgi:beta-lactam-binding protein with PASTA domain